MQAEQYNVITSDERKIVRAFLSPYLNRPTAYIEILDKLSDGTWRVTQFCLDIHEIDKIRNGLEPPEVR